MNDKTIALKLHRALFYITTELKLGCKDCALHTPLDNAAHTIANILATLEKSFGVQPLEPLHAPKVDVETVLFGALEDVQQSIMAFTGSPYASNDEVIGQLWQASRDLDFAIYAMNYFDAEAEAEAENAPATEEVRVLH